MSTGKYQTSMAAATAAVACLLTATSPATVYHSVDFSNYHNQRMQDRFGLFGPAPEGYVTLGGVPFAVPAGVNNEWSLGEQFDNNGVTSVLDIPVGIFGMRYAYTLISSYWGSPTGGRTQVEFIGSAGAYAVKDLLGDRDIRDWNVFPGYTTQINGTSTKQVFANDPGRNGTPDVVDMQRYDLPPDFATQTLDRIIITDHRQVGVHSGIVSGITVSDLPAPGSAVLLGLGGLLARRRR